MGMKMQDNEQNILLKMREILATRDVECTICLNDIKEDEIFKGHVKMLQCMHLFHGECILTWLDQYKNTCPNCREQGKYTSSSDQLYDNSK